MSEDFLKKLCVADIILILLVYTFVLLTPLAQSYELNIYSVFPPVFLFFILAIISISITIIILSEYFKVQGYWKVALSSMIMLYSIILLLPLIRGYYMYARGTTDVFAHLSWAQYIVNNGTINTMYPMVHILIVNLHLIGINMEIAVKILPIFATIIFILGLIILSRSLQKGKWISVLPILFALPLLYADYHHSMAPYFWGFVYLPLIFYFILKSFKNPNKPKYTLLIIVIAFFIVYAHPLINIFLIVFILLFILVNTVLSRRDQNLLSRKRYLTQLVGILSISFVFWYLSFSRIWKNIIDVANAIVDPPDETTISRMSENVATSDADLLYILKLFVINYGPIAFYLILGLVCVLVVLYTIKMKKASMTEIHLATQYVLAGLIGLAFLMGYLVVGGIVRPVSLALFIGATFSPFVIIKFIANISSKQTKKVIYFLIATIFVIVIALGLFSTFITPYKSLPSWHMTHMENHGLDWFLGHNIEKVPVVTLGERDIYPKYEMYYNERYQFPSSRRISYFNLLKTHFGYETNMTLGDSLDGRQYYYLSTEFHRQTPLALPENRRELLAQITSKDIIRLKQDDSIHRIYCNGEFESWLIPGSL